MIGNGYNIFYTDDDVDDLEFFREAVASVSNDHTVYLQSHGDELLGLLETPPGGRNLIFLDINMPEKDGLEVLRELRQMPQVKDVPVVMLSTSDDESTIKASRELGANLYIPKPNSYAEFKKIMAALLLNEPGKDYFTGNGYVYRS